MSRAADLRKALYGDRNAAILVKQEAESEPAPAEKPKPTKATKKGA